MNFQYIEILLVFMYPLNKLGIFHLRSKQQFKFHFFSRCSNTTNSIYQFFMLFIGIQFLWRVHYFVQFSFNFSSFQFIYFYFACNRSLLSASILIMNCTHLIVVCVVVLWYSGRQHNSENNPSKLFTWVVFNNCYMFCSTFGDHLQAVSLNTPHVIEIF